jgi:acetoin utilization protein AcuB
MNFVWYVEGRPRDYAVERALLPTRRVDPAAQISALAAQPSDEDAASRAPAESATSDSSPKPLFNPYSQSKQREPRQPALLVSQIMTSPVQSLSPETSLQAAWELFREKRFRHIPVVIGYKQIAGIISDRDLLRILARTSSADSSAAPDLNLRTSSIAEHMKREVLCAFPETTIHEVAGILLEQRIGSMPVVDPHGGLVGIVTRSDILRCVVQQAPLELWI